MKRQPISSLHIRLWLLILLALLPLAGLMINTAIEQRRLAVRDISRNAELVTRLITAENSRLIDNARQTLVALAQYPALINREPVASNALLRRLGGQYPFFTAFVAFRPNGESFATSLSLARPVRADDLSFFSLVLKKRNFVVGNYEIGRVSHQPTLVCAYPILDAHNHLQGVLSAGISLRWYSRLVVQLGLPKGASLIILDRKGTLLVHYPPGRNRVGENLAARPLIARVLKQHRGLLESVGLDRVKRLYAFGPLGGGATAEAAYLVVGIPRHEAVAEANPLLARNLAVLFFVGLCTIVVGWFGSNIFVLSQVEALIRMAERLGAGDFTARTGLSGRHGELSQLAATFDAMAGRMESLIAERQQAASAIAQRDAEIKKAQELDLLRNRFVSAVSHELRTPLTSITGYSEFLEDQIGGPLTAQQAEFVREIQRATSRVGYLVDDLLDFARLEAGTFRLTVQETDFNERINAVVDSLRPQAEGAHLRLKTDLPGGPLLLRLDPRRIEQVLINLLNNAIKFTPAGGVICVSTRLEGGTLRCEVQDTGIGIAEADLPKLFHPFSQLEGGMKQGGTGLGLSISKSIIDSHGGHMGVSSAPGRGSTFWFTLPMQAAASRDLPSEMLS